MQFSYRISSVSNVNATFDNLLCIGTVVQFAEVQPCCVKLWLVSDEIHQLHKQFSPAEYHHKVVPKERACKWANSPYEVEGTYDPSPTPPSSTMVPSEFQPTAAPLPVNNPNLKLAILFYNSRLTRYTTGHKGSFLTIPVVMRSLHLVSFVRSHLTNQFPASVVQSGPIRNRLSARPAGGGGSAFLRGSH